MLACNTIYEKQEYIFSKIYARTHIHTHTHTHARAHVDIHVCAGAHTHKHTLLGIGWIFKGVRQASLCLFNRSISVYSIDMMQGFFSSS